MRQGVNHYDDDDVPSIVATGKRMESFQAESAATTLGVEIKISPSDTDSDDAIQSDAIASSNSDSVDSDMENPFTQ